MSGEDYLKLRQTIDHLLRSGQTELVRVRLSDLNLSGIPIKHRQPLAALARRANLFTLGLRILSPVIQNDRNPVRRKANPLDLAEYGILLCHIGCRSAGLRTLETINPDEVPDCLLYRAFGHFGAWEFDAAVPLLRRYVNQPGLTNYARVVGRTNLALAYVGVERFDLAAAELAIIERFAREEGHGRILSNAMELRAQMDILHGRPTAANAKLEEASRLMIQARSFDQLSIDKWRSVCMAQQTNDPRALLEFRRRAIGRKHWESVRDADFHLFRLTKDAKLFQYLYYGTPHSAFRARLRRIGGSGIQPDPFFTLGTGHRVLNLQNGTIEGKIFVNPGKKIHQLLEALFSDFYRPLHLGELFAMVFPGEYFFVESSPQRLHQLIFRARQIFDRNGIELVVEEGLYQVRYSDDFSVRISSDLGVSDTKNIYLGRLREAFADRAFTAREARERLELPLTTFHLILKLGISTGELVSLGAGPKTRYQFTAQPQAVPERIRKVA